MVILSLLVLNGFVFAGDKNEGPSLLEVLHNSVFSNSTLRDPGKNKDTYAAWKVYDGDVNSAWISGPKNDDNDDDQGGGIGITLKFMEGCDISKVFGIKILHGFVTDSILFPYYNRPKVLSIEFSASEYAIQGSERWLSFKKDILLDDVYHYQKFMFDKAILDYVNEFDKKNGYKSNFGTVQLRIVSVYKGIKYNNTAISEIRFLDKNGNEIDPLKNYKK